MLLRSSRTTASKRLHQVDRPSSTTVGSFFVSNPADGNFVLSPFRLRQGVILTSSTCCEYLCWTDVGYMLRRKP